MTEQPEQPRSEQEWLGNSHHPLGHGFKVNPELLEELRRGKMWTVEETIFKFSSAPRKGLHEEAGAHAVHGVKALENGELDAGIAWLQSALAFAQNARHLRDVEASA